MEPGDPELVLRAQRSDAGAFAVLVARHRAAIREHARRLAFDTDDAEDIAQETFVAAYQHLATLRNPSAFAAWLRRIATNLARQRWRRATQGSMEPLWDDDTPGSPTTSACADRSTARVREIVRDALAALPPEPRDAGAIVLRYGVSKQLPTFTQWAVMTEIPATISGLAPAELFSLALNREYLTECLQALSLMPADPVTLRLNDPSVRSRSRRAARSTSRSS